MLRAFQYYYSFIAAQHERLVGEHRWLPRCLNGIEGKHPICRDSRAVLQWHRRVEAASHFVLETIVNALR